MCTSQFSIRSGRYRTNTRHFLDHDGRDTAVHKFQDRLHKADVARAAYNRKRTGTVLLSSINPNLSTLAR